MNLDSLTCSLLQISRLVANLNKENYKQTAQQLSQLVSVHGLEAERTVVRCLLATASSEQERPGSAAAHCALLAERLLSLLNHPARATVFASLLELRPQDSKKNQKLPNTVECISKFLKLTKSQDVALSLALRRASEQPTEQRGEQRGERASSEPEEKRLQQQFLHLVHGYLGNESGHNVESDGLQDCSPEVLQTLLISLAEDILKILPVTKDLFLQRLRTDFPREVAPIILAPLLYPDDTSCPLDEVTTSADLATAMMECSLADSIKDIGFAFTSSVEECKKYILNFGVLEPTAVDVSKIILTMIRFQPTQEGPKILTPGNFWMNHDPPKENNESWNPEVLVQAVKELASNVNWKEVIIQLDQPEFFVPSRQSLNLLFTILRAGLLSDGYSANVFPVEYLCRRWQNSEGQFSLISNILRHPDIFSFADFPLHPVGIDMLKTPPEIDNKEVATWRGLYLIELLLYLSERGYYVQVQELFKFPLQHCPDVLLLALLQITSATVLRQELLTGLVPIFLGNHPNSGILLQHAWHTQNPNLKPVIMHAMADWYIRGDCDQTKLSRILDIAQDLKALSLLLNVQSFPFVIDLACLASRREYLKLDKWLTDKIRDHGEAFVTAIVKFLQRRCPGPDEAMPKVAQLPPETVGTLLACLQLCLSNVQQELQEAIYNVIANQTLAMTKLRQMMPRSRLSESFGSNLINHIDPTVSLAPAMNSLSIGNSFMNGSPSRMIASNSPFVIQTVSIPVERVPIPVETPRIPDPIPLPDMAQKVPKDIEDEANGYFQKVYNHPPYPSLSIDEVLDMLKKFQDSSNKREREVYACMIRNLFEEYKFFPNYPEKELYITAQLFGGIIEKGLVPSYVSLGLALRFVLDALRKPDDSKLYYFGLVALDRFKSRLKDYHMYCEHVRVLPNFKQFPPHLVEYVEFGLQSQEPPSKPTGPLLPASLAAIVGTQTPPVTAVTTYRAPTASVISKIVSVGPGGRPSIANATNIDTLLTADAQENITPPPEAIQDKTFFIFNNLSQLNLQMKCDELKAVLTEEYYPWLSQYLVMKRASIEFNFHVLYSNFLDILSSKTVNKLVTAETYRNIKVLLRTEKGIENFSDRSLLKNLGHWLGVITLGRNQPILHNDLDLKSLLLEAYHKGQQELLYVVPFVAKILESCSKGCFKPPNPWTMALINVLAELHQEQDLKLNLKFEVEVLCKNLSLDITELKPALYLKNTENLKRVQFQLSLEKVRPKLVLPPLLPPPPMIPTDTGVSVPIPAAFIPTESVNDVIIVPEPKFNYHDLNLTVATFEQRITYNPHIALFQTYPHLKQLVKPSIERSIQEWIHPVVDRSIKQVVTTCELIIRKDFAFEPNEMRVRMAAHHMMRSLTAAMALVTCRGQIVSTMTTNLKTAFATALLPTTQHQKELIEGAAALLSSDNMELACAYIQKTAVDKALPEIDKRLAKDYELRQLARQDGRRCYNEIYDQRIPTRVQPRVGGPTDVQVMIYEEFARHIPGFQAARADAPPAVPPQTVDPAQIYIDELTAIAACAETFAARSSSAALAANARLLAEFAIRARRARDGGAARALLQRAVEGLLDSHTTAGDQADAVNVYRELHIRALQLLADARVYGRAWCAKHASVCALQCRDALRFHAEPVRRLLAARLLDHQHYDVSLAQLIDDGKNYAAVSFAMQLVQLTLGSSTQAVETFPHTVDALIRAMSARTAPEGLSSLVEAIKVTHRALPEALPLDPLAMINQGILQVRARDYNDPPDLQEKTEGLLRDWRHFLQTPLTELEIGQSFHVYVHRMDLSGILRSDDTMSRFLRIGAMCCVAHVYRLLEEDSGQPAYAVRRQRYYTMCDSFMKLVALLVKHADGDGAAPKLRLLGKVLGIIAGCLLQDHEELGKSFQQLPYQRMLLILFLDMVTLEPLLETVHGQVVTIFCQALHMVRPSVAPGFCYSWLDLIAHRVFIDRVLTALPQRKGWDLYAGLLMDLFTFLDPLLKTSELAPPVMAFYRGTVKVLLVLHHDFPQFLVRFCDQFAPQVPQLGG